MAAAGDPHGPSSSPRVLIERASSPLRGLTTPVRAVGGAARSAGGVVGRSLRRVGSGVRTNRRRARRRRTRREPNGAADVATELAGEGCGCLFEGLLDGLFALLLVAGLGWLVANVTGGGA